MVLRKGSDPIRGQTPWPPGRLWRAFSGLRMSLPARQKIRSVTGLSLREGGHPWLSNIIMR